MQIVFLPDWLTVLLFFCMWFFFQLGAALWCKRLDISHFTGEGGIYACRSWEQGGEIYQRLFRVKRWKKYLPDGGAVVKSGYRKRHLAGMSREELTLFLAESRRAELTHWLGIAPFWVFGFFAPPQVIGIMLLYALAVNMPCIIAQRYNRPRIERLLNTHKRRAQHNSEAN